MPRDTASEHAVATRTPSAAGGGGLAVAGDVSPAIQTVELALQASTAYQRPDLAVRARQALQRLQVLATELDSAYARWETLDKARLSAQQY